MNIKNFLILTLIFATTFSFSQEDQISIAKQNAVSSMSLVDALASRIPGARKITDRMGNKNISIRGRQSFKSAGNEVLWEIDGVLYTNPPSLNASQVKYVEVLSGLAATNKYGSRNVHELTGVTKNGSRTLVRSVDFTAASANIDSGAMTVPANSIVTDCSVVVTTALAYASATLGVSG